VLPLLFAAVIGQAIPSCSGADPAVVSAAVSNVTDNGDLKHYTVIIIVQNLGDKKQPGNTLQSIDVYRDGQKVDAKGVPPLGPGQSYRFDYGLDRSSLAGDGTTQMLFRLQVHSPAVSRVDCNPNNDIYGLAL
jgi:hypothetical protein